MKPIKTLTVGGETYQITDPEAARLADDAVDTNTAWSSRNIVDRLCPAFTETGEQVCCEPVAGYPLAVTAAEEATQIYRFGKNLFDSRESKMQAVSWIRADGTASGEYWGFELILPPGNYVICATPKVPHTETYLYGQVNTLDGEYLRSWSPVYGNDFAAKMATFTQWVRVVIYFAGAGIAAGVAKNQAMSSFDKYHIQMETGSKATDFEPCNGGTFAVGETIPALPGVNTLWADTGSITVTGRADPCAVIAKLQSAVIALGGNI